MEPWKIPSSSEVNVQLAYCSSVKQMEVAIERYTDLYLHCPVAHFGTLAWEEWNNITKAAEPYVQKNVREWKRGLIEADDPRTRSWYRPKKAGPKHTRSGSKGAGSARARHRRSSSQ